MRGHWRTAYDFDNQHFDIYDVNIYDVNIYDVNINDVNIYAVDQLDQLDVYDPPLCGGRLRQCAFHCRLRGGSPGGKHHHHDDHHHQLFDDDHDHDPAQQSGVLDA